MITGLLSNIEYLVELSVQSIQVRMTLTLAISPNNLHVTSIVLEDGELILHIKARAPAKNKKFVY